MNQEIDKLQGTWTVLSLQADGMAVPASVISGARIVVRENRFVSLGMVSEYEGTIEMDGSADPKTFDLKFTAGPEKGNTNPGIYELEGDRWRFCLNTKGAARPQSFTSDPGSGFVVELLERIEDAPYPPFPTDFPA